MTSFGGRRQRRSTCVGTPCGVWRNWSGLTNAVTTGVRTTTAPITRSPSNVPSTPSVQVGGHHYRYRGGGGLEFLPFAWSFLLKALFYFTYIYSNIYITFISTTFVVKIYSSTMTCVRLFISPISFFFLQRYLFPPPQKKKPPAPPPPPPPHTHSILMVAPYRSYIIMIMMLTTSK